MVSGLVVVLVVALVQVVLGLHVRNTLIDSAAEGARHAALAGAGHAAGVERTRELISAGLSSSYADHVSATTVQVSGATLVRVDVSAPLPVIGLLGPRGMLEVSGHAIQEDGP